MKNIRHSTPLLLGALCCAAPSGMSALLCVHEAEPTSDAPAMHDVMVNICKFVRALRGAAEEAKLNNKKLERDGASDEEVKVRAKLKIAQGIYRLIVNKEGLSLL
ncbi:hypothetical protein ERJ75_000159500 [Trypanosoma vivax]|nr:hypothetical protein ERJ75_000159500 [Trypanosoma vivax]